MFQLSFLPVFSNRGSKSFRDRIRQIFLFTVFSSDWKKLKSRKMSSDVLSFEISCHTEPTHIQRNQAEKFSTEANDSRPPPSLNQTNLSKSRFVGPLVHRSVGRCLRGTRDLWQLALLILWTRMALKDWFELKIPKTNAWEFLRGWERA